MVTIGCGDIHAGREAYCRYLHYEVAGEGAVTAELAGAWGLEGMAGAAYILLSPASDDEHFIRLMQTEDAPGYRPFTTFGWNAMEIVVNNVDELAAGLQDSPFEIVGPPDDLSFTDKIRASQVVGPSKEVLYLTQIKGEVPGFDLPRTSQQVGHCFVMILGASNISDAIGFYHDTFAVGKSPVINARLRVLSAASGLPAEHQHRISALTLNAGYLLEVDQFPEKTANRSAPPGKLPPGIAMVSFEVDNIHAVSPDFSGSAIACGETPYGDRRVITVTGPDNELIELIETGQ